jgi:hypothetical protein
MRIEYQRHENAYVNYATLEEFATDLPNWILGNWHFSEARRDVSDGAIIRVQYMRSSDVTTNPDLGYIQTPIGRGRELWGRR